MGNRKSDKRAYALKAKIFKALGHPRRLMIIDALQRGAKNVNELASIIGVSLATTSRHLSLLREAGLVSEGERRGNMIFYRLETTCIPDFMSCAVKVIRKKREESK